MIACGVALAAEPPAAITLLEGQAALLRGTVRYALAEGVRLQNGDIVELGDKGTAQIEFADGCILSLGPKARFYIGGLTSRGAAKGGGISDFYLMQGWSKLASGKSAAPLRITTPVFGLGTADATAVIQLADGEGAMFVETGEVRLTEGFVKASPTSPVQAARRRVLQPQGRPEGRDRSAADARRSSRRCRGRTWTTCRRGSASTRTAR